ncbi:hypothetical protein F7Q99_36315 [Streptomyces kaniharaensis]|uniref:Uncharacterized protein n=1 Tax=Streptomyces kaniharaensis TaxID=212423 RepID=A0A6N7L4F9_9ACTN|nr:hypothetical protein [Streptomyces kaniharaensis]MQS17508.1 hypothetical protein [Streptomyces kaniharaensis]
MPAPTKTKDPENGSRRLHPAQRPRDTSNDLFMLKMWVKERSGVKAPLRLCAPADPAGTAGRQLVHLAAYLAERKREAAERRNAAADPTSAGALAFLSSREAWASYPYPPLHDSRVTCQLDVRLGPLDETGWPAVSVVVLESEPGRWGFSRKRKAEGAGAVIRMAREEIEAEHVHLCSRAVGTNDPGVVELRDQVDVLRKQAAELHKLGQQLTDTEGARKARAALHDPVVPEPGTSHFVQLDPLPERMEVFTGTIREIETRTGADGQVVTLFGLAHQQGRFSASGHEIPQVLRCKLTGQAARRASGLPAGRPVVAAGRLVQQIYMPSEQQLPRSLTTFDVQVLGTDLLTQDPAS